MNFFLQRLDSRKNILLLFTSRWHNTPATNQPTTLAIVYDRLFCFCFVCLLTLTTKKKNIMAANLMIRKKNIWPWTLWLIMVIVLIMCFFVTLTKTIRRIRWSIIDDDDDPFPLHFNVFCTAFWPFFFCLPKHNILFAAVVRFACCNSNFRVEGWLAWFVSMLCLMACCCCFPKNKIMVQG